MKYFSLIPAILAFLIICGSSAEAMECDLCGDLNGDGTVNIADLTAFAEWISNSVVPPCPCAADVNCDGAVRITFQIDGDPMVDDFEYFVNYLFGGGPAPCDPDGDGDLDCDPCG